MIFFAILIIAFVVVFFVVRNSKAGKAWKEEQARKEREARLKAENEAWLKQYKKTAAKAEKEHEEFDEWLDSVDDNLNPIEREEPVGTEDPDE